MGRPVLDLDKKQTLDPNKWYPLSRASFESGVNRSTLNRHVGGWIMEGAARRCLLYDGSNRFYYTIRGRAVNDLIASWRGRHGQNE